MLLFWTGLILENYKQASFMYYVYYIVDDLHNFQFLIKKSTHKYLYIIVETSQFRVLELSPEV